MKQFEHIEASGYDGFPCIVTSDVIGLVHLAEAHGVKFIFRKGAPDKQSAPEEFFINLLHQSGMLCAARRQVPCR